MAQTSGTLPTIYNGGEKVGVALIAGAGYLSILAALFYAVTFRLMGKHYLHLTVYFISLLICNTLQAIGAALNTPWIPEGGVYFTDLCQVQGALKNAGNVGTAVWSFLLALHMFNLLFLRARMNALSTTLTLIAGWFVILFVPLIGITVIETQSRGPYFGVSGLW